MSAAEPTRDFDYDWLVIGSGFGGSVSALRLAEKGYSVGVLECGRRFEDDDFAKTTWDLARYYWVPKLGLKGIFRMTLFKDIFIVSGCGVGGGSLGYANTLYRPASPVFRDPQWDHLSDDWEQELAPHFDESERMLGVTEYEGEGPADELLRDLADELGVSDSYHRTRVGVFFNEEAPGETVGDPYFGGDGPERAGCIRCGACMPGCRYNAKNTLMKNYLWFAERRGVEITPERMVSDIRPLGRGDGSEGYEIASERSGAWVRKDRQTHTARAVVVAAGPLGTNRLLQRCKLEGSLPRLSDRLGYVVRTNSESIPAVSIKDDRLDFTKSIAITSSIHPDDDTHIENVTYGRGADSMSFLWTLLTGPGNRLTRPLRFLANALRHPIGLARATWPFKFSRRTVILLVMQTVDNKMRLKPRKFAFGRGIRLTTEQDPETPNPTYLPVANWAAERAAEKLDGVAQIGAPEALLNTPLTAHVLGGAVMGADSESGVIDADHRTFGYENLMVCDGSTIPVNLGVNPSLTITAMAELAMSKVPPRDGASQDSGSPPSAERQRAASGDGAAAVAPNGAGAEQRQTGAGR
jgi:cholesterol oxidase